MDGKAEAVNTVIEQTKLLVTLASGFIIAPAAAVSWFKTYDPSHVVRMSLRLFFSAEGMLIASVIAGYIVLGSIAGSQHSGDFNVYRTATRLFSLFQMGLYLGGILCFVFLMRP